MLVIDGPVAEDIRVLRDKRNIKRMFQAGREVALAPDRGPIGADFKVAEWLDEPLGRTETRSRAVAGRP
jgi:hypothetical protein